VKKYFNNMENNKPVAKCSKCGHYTDNPALINQSCPRKFVKSGKCGGVYVGMISDGDWKKCENCIDSSNKNDCLNCQGTGWVCTRKNY
jgi:hypothetical protein